MGEIKINRINVLRGPNVWAHQPVIEAHISLGSYEERPTDVIPGFTDRLLELLPTLWSHRCSEGKPGGFIIRLRDGTWMGHVIEHIALELLALAGMDVSYGKTRSEGEGFPGQYRVVIEYREERSGKLSIRIATELCEAVANEETYDVEEAVEDLRELSERGLPDPATASIISAGRSRNIPWIRRADEGVVQLGYGKKGRRITEEHVSRVLERAGNPTEDNLARAAEELVAQLFPEGENGRIPIVAITGTNGKTTVTRMIGHIMQAAGYTVGMPTTDGIYLNGKLLYAGDCSGPQSAEDVLLMPEVEVAVLETARGGIIRAGLGFDVCDVGVLLNVSADHIGLGGVHSVERLASVKGVVIEAVRRKGYGVLNADDPLVAGMARYCDGTPIFFSRSPESPVLLDEVEAGGLAFTIVNSDIVLQEGDKTTHLLAAADIPATYGGNIPFQVDNALAAAAAAWGLGVAPDVIASGLRTFSSSAETVPGRFNLFTGPGYWIVQDYAHNPAAMRALGGVVASLKRSLGAQRTIGVVAAPGDRRDKEILDVATIAAESFDVLIVRDDDDLRGRAPDAVSGMMAEAARKVLPSENVYPVQGEFPALHKALDMLRTGDLLVVCAVEIEQSLADIRAKIAGDSD